MSPSTEIVRYGVTLSRLGEENLELVRAWRTDPKISRYMEYRGPISSEDQRRWFASIDNAQNHYFVIEHGGQKIGLANVKDVDFTTRTGEYGIFIYDDEHLNSLVPICVVIALLEFAFDEIQLDTMLAHILRDNPRAQRFNLALGFEIADDQDEVENQLYSVSRERFSEKAEWFRRTVLRGFSAP